MSLWLNWEVKHIEQIYNNCGDQIARQFPHHKEGHKKEKPEKQIALVELLKNKFLVVSNQKYSASMIQENRFEN